MVYVLLGGGKVPWYVCFEEFSGEFADSMVLMGLDLRKPQKIIPKRYFSKAQALKKHLESKTGKSIPSKDS